MSESFWTDLRHAARRLRRAPRFTIAAAVMLAVGIGLTAGLATIIAVTAFSRWPVDKPEQLVWLSATAGNGRTVNFPFSEYQELRAHARTLKGLAAVRWGAALLAVDREAAADNVQAAWVSGDFFQVAGFHTVAGRSLLPADDQTGAAPVAVVSERWWRRRLHGDPGVIGHTILLRGKPITLVGVLAHRYATASSGANVYDVWAPLQTYAALLGSDIDRLPVWTLARMGEGVTREQVRSELGTLTRDTHLDAGRARTGVIVDDTMPGLPPARRGLFGIAFGSVVALVLLMSANIGNLQLARTLRRRRDLAIHLAIGASRLDIVRQIFAETLLLSVLAAVTGLAGASVVLPIVERAVSPGATLPTWIPDLRVAGLAAAIAVMTTIAIGLASWSRARRLTPRIAGSDPGHEHGQAVRTSLLGLQVALCALLLGTTALLSRGVVHALSIDAGFDRDGIAAVNIVPPATLDPSHTAALRTRVRGILETIAPSVGEADLAPLENISLVVTLRKPGEAAAEGTTVALRPMSGDAFSLLGIPLVAGRHVDPNAQVREMVVNESFARRYGGNVLERILLDRQREYRIVGIVRDAQMNTLSAVVPTVHPAAGLIRPLPEFLVPTLRTSLPQIEALIRRSEPGISLKVTTLDAVAAASLAPTRQAARASSALAIIGVLLATIGIYAVFGAMVEERTREIGIRMALGARGRHVIRQIVGAAMTACGLGLAAGLVLSSMAGYFLRALLYGLSPVDPAAGAAVVTVLLISAAFAAFLPARRATRIDPAIALRNN